MTRKMALRTGRKMAQAARENGSRAGADASAKNGSDLSPEMAQKMALDATWDRLSRALVPAVAPRRHPVRDPLDVALAHVS